MATACPEGEVKTLTALRRMSSNSVKMGLLMTSQESLENNAAAEFKHLSSLSATSLFPTTVGTSEVMSNKNRWKDHVPYDHNRVVLTNLDESTTMNEDTDYINASFIRQGHFTTGGYIATQGPMLGTVEDLWRMVWVQNSRLIVMMSRTVEGYQTRSYKYWPEPGESMDVDILMVSTEWEYEKASYVERKIVLKHGKSEETRTVYQLQFLSWPEEADSLPCVPSFVSFWKAFRKLQSNEWGPPVVHCSNGSHRTSLLIAMDILYKQQEEAETVDFFGTVMRMREDRAHAVNNLEHYTFLHYALIEACTSTSHSKEEDENEADEKSASSATTSPSAESPDSTMGKIRTFFKGDSQDEALSKINERGSEDEDEEEDDQGDIANFVISPLRNSILKKKNNKGDVNSDGTILGKTLEDIEEEFRNNSQLGHEMPLIQHTKTSNSFKKVFSSQTSTEPPIVRSKAGSFISKAVGPSSVVHKVALGRKPSFHRCQTQISIPVENGNIPVICIPLNHPFLRRMSTQKHARLRHSASLQDSYIISDISGVLPREYKKSFLVTTHTRVTSPDFWQVLYDTGSCLVVRVFDSDSNEQVSDLNSIETSDFKLRVIEEKDLTDNIRECKLTLKPHVQPGSFDEEESNKVQTIKMLTVKGIPDDQDTIPIPVLLRLFFSMDRWLSRSSTSLVNVHSSAGLSVVGFLCAAYNALSNLKVRDEADVYIAARIIQDRIPVALTMTQYVQLYTLCDLYKKMHRIRSIRSLKKSSTDSHSSTEEAAN